MRAALYGRYSTDKQSEASIADQLRVCVRLAERHGFEVAETFADAAISGGTSSRPGYQSLLAAARMGQFDVIVAEDASRLWRNMSEQSQRLAELRDRGIHVVTHDLDTRQESAAIMGAVTGAMSEHYRSEIARRTRRGLEGLARQKKLTGGRAYGYIARDGQREIVPEQAEILREIFTRYAQGWSPRAIAADLNARGVPSPGATWKRSSQRASGWRTSAIAGDPKRATGLLNNDLYRGVVIWNRARWVRSAVDGKQRRQVMNPVSEWVQHEDETLRIIPDKLWRRVKARQQARTDDVGELIAQGVARSRAARVRGAPKYLFSGMLKCGICGSNFVMVNRTHYACASRTNGGMAACHSDVWVKRTVVEAGLLAGIKRDLLQPEMLAEIQKRVRKALAATAKKASPARRIGQLRSEVANLTDAIASGLLKASPAIGQRLATAEAELAKLMIPQPTPPTVDVLLPRLAERCRDAVQRLEELDLDLPRARQELAELMGGSIRIDATDTEIVFRNEKGRMEAALLRAVGGAANQVQIDVVAGVGFEPTTFGL